MKVYPLSLSLASFEHSSGLAVHLPLTLPEVARLQVAPERVASYLKHQLETDLAQKGRYLELLPHVSLGDLQVEALPLTIGPSDQQRYPQLTLHFDLFWGQVTGQCLGFIPVLGLQAAAPDLPALRAALTDSIRLEFIRKKRLQEVRKLLAVQWFQDATVHRLAIELPFYTLTEQAEIERVKDQSLLTEVATHLVPSDPVCFGLEQAYEQTCNAMRGRQRSSLLLVGESGQGKTALIHHLVSQRKALGLSGIAVWETTAAQLLHRLTDSGGWEGQLGKLCRELRDTGDWLYIPDFAEMFEVGQYAGNNRSMADYLRPFLTRGELTILTECTPATANQIELRAPGYLSLFARVDLPTMGTAQLQDVVRQKVQHLAQQRQVQLEEGVIRETLRLQQWFTPYSGLPGKTIQFLDALLADTAKRQADRVAQADIYARFGEETGLPDFIIDPAVPLDLAQTEAFFRRNIYGQGEAIHTILDLLVAIKTAVIRRGKPLASLLFAGPTGVGKTEMAKVLAQYLFGDRGRMIRFDMSEYRDLPALMRLTGDDGRGEGMLTAAVRQQPFSVILFDELEKVNPLFYDLLLQILGEGRLTSSTGRVADFSSTLIIMTSNIGARDFQTGGVGFVPSQDQAADAAAHFREAVQAHFRPELFNRLDRIIAFAPLSRSTLRQIVNRELQLVRQREGLRGRAIELLISQAAADHLGEVGYHPLYGARYLQRVLQRELILPLARHLVEHPTWQALDIMVEAEAQGLTLLVEKRPDLPLAEQVVDSYHHTLEELGDAISEARRRLTRLRDGQLFVQLLNRLDSLAAELRRLRKYRQEARFWQDTQQSEWYTKATELVERQAQLAATVQDLEQDALACLMGLQEDVTTLMPRHEAWSASCQAWVREVVHLMHPHWRRCVVALYGRPEWLAELVAFYQRAIQRMHMQVEAYVLWHSEADEANRLASIRLAEKVGDADDVAKAEQMSVYRQEPLDWPADQPPAVPDHACGVLLALRGELVYPYWDGEAGLHRWQMAEGEEQSKLRSSCVAEVKAGPLTDYQVPMGVHRREFFRDRKLRRTFLRHGLVQDKHYALKTQPCPQEHLLDWLGQRWGLRLEQAMG